LKVAERINSQVDLVHELVRELEAERSYGGTERLVQLAIQALLDLGLMVTSALGGRRPKGYSEVGDLLVDLGALGESDSKLLRSMVGMRNVLVHAYATLKRDTVSDASRSLREDAPRIALALSRSLKGRVLDPPSRGELDESLKKVLEGRVAAALLFGGRAKGYSMKGDYDVAVFFGRPYSLYELGGLVVEVARALRVPEDEVDLLALDSAAPELVLEALEGEVISVNDPYVLFELKLRALMEYLDLRTGIEASLKVESNSCGGAQKRGAERFAEDEETRPQARRPR